MPNDLVAYSRAGDIFHYRWAARRCLKMIYPNSSLQSIVIEGSAEDEKAGEYVIDVTEYYDLPDQKQKIAYYQLKHTTVQQDEPFLISNLKETFEGFAKRFIQHQNESDNIVSNSKLEFRIITNRKIDSNLKKNIEAIAKNEQVDKRFITTIEKYTNLTSEKLSIFCNSVIFEDNEGNYNVQRNELRTEIAQLLTGSVDNAQIDNIIALVSDRVLPDSDGKITKEDILKRFGISSERELYPAPTAWGKLENIIKREQYGKLIKSISESSYPVIVHAAGGIGKSIFCRQMVNSLPEGDFGIAFDCFGAGRYRNRSETRHRHRDALVQIVNELSVQGLCDPLLIRDTSSDEDIMRKFLLRLDMAIKFLRNINETATLFIFIDAADNAEMAAIEFNQDCFSHELLRENIPDGCKLILLCRTERIHLLQPLSYIPQFELEAFSEIESFENLKTRFSEASEQDGLEFHRLTSCNPRVQSNALDLKMESVAEMLSSLGPFGMTVNEQISLQLGKAVLRIKDILPAGFQVHIDAICVGLASLPPHIPIDILSKASKVGVEEVKSFVADIGQSLWISDTSIQFRDEPTETWFRENFCAAKSDFETYIQILEPLAHSFSYVAEVLPQLYLQAGQYKKLIDIALSDDYLPEENPIDARNIRVYRLQFAFKAALKSKQYSDAIKLAMRAGEEVAGNQRQLTLFQKNIDLLILLQSKEKVQDIAFKRLLSGKWNGSENIYTASLLSGIPEYKGEARGFLRSSVNWLRIYFDELRKNQDATYDNQLENEDILELSYAYLNILGVNECIAFLEKFKSKESIFNIITKITGRLIDVGNFEVINEFLQNCIRKPYFTVAVTSELVQISKFPEAKLIETCLNLLSYPKCRIKKSNNYCRDIFTSSIVAFIEACLHRKLSSQKILRVLRYYVPIKASRLVYRSHHFDERETYLKALAIRALLAEKLDVDINSLLPDELLGKEKGYKVSDEINELKEVINGLLPWFLLRANVIAQKEQSLFESAKLVDEISKKARSSRYRTYDTLPNEIANICASVLMYYTDNQEELVQFFNAFIRKNNSLWIQHRLAIVRAAFRLSHLKNFKRELEQITYDAIKIHKERDPEEIADRFVMLARAVLVASQDDASVYFDEAVNIVSKFGDELVERWRAVVSLAKQTTGKEPVENELTYRFIRCAEMVGESVEREKYWNRSEAIRVCARMSTSMSISAFSRWRDRDIGRFDDQFKALLSELVDLGSIPVSIGWALSPLFSDYHSKDFIDLCLKNECTESVRQFILDDAVHILQIEGTHESYWKDLNKVAINHKLQNNQLSFIEKFYQKQETIAFKVPSNIILAPQKDIASSEDINGKWDSIFEDINVLSSDGLSESKKRFELILRGNYKDIGGFWEEVLSRISESEIWEFIDLLLTSDFVIWNDILNVFDAFPKDWLNKISFKNKWPNLVKRIGKKYAKNLSILWVFNCFIESLKIEESTISKFREGIFDGLADGCEFADASSFFGFVELASTTLNTTDAIIALDFSLYRFELHIKDDFGDGLWASWLHVSDDIINNVAGFIWSALGSPKSDTRWRAAHCVRKLIELNCLDVLDALMYWLDYDKVGAFGHHKYPFYNLHARQYLLIALARVSIQRPTSLRKYSNIFAKYAIEKPHILIQKFASDIAINLSKSFPDLYDREILNLINDIGKSKMPLQEADYGYRVDSFWHINNEIDQNIDFNFGWDFDRYWFEPLGRVFGVAGNQIENLAANVIINDWGVQDSNGYNKDPRVDLWNRYSNERETSHDHGSYPRTDNLDFYLSYHSMFVVAANLIQKMPVLFIKDWEEDNWESWLSGHLLTRSDGKWLADCKDPLPLKRPNWILKDRINTWKSDITETDFFNCLITEDNEEVWINVRGGWHEKAGERTEKYSISTALVSKGTSDSLLRALDTCIDPYDYKLPDYEEERTEIDSEPFILKGWIYRDHISKRIDKYDLYANDIDYPPYSIGESIKGKLTMSVCEEGKIWHSPSLKEPSLICEIWSSHRDSKDEEQNQIGKRLKASLSFLKLLCVNLDFDIIFKVGIEREINSRYQEEKREYISIYKVFVLSADGKLRNTATSYQLG